MALINMRDMLQYAYQKQFAIVAVDITNLTHLESCLIAAEQSQSPVILNFSESLLDEFSFAALLAAAERLAQDASVPVVLQFIDAAYTDSVVQAINTGCNGVMIDVSHKTLRENIAITKEIVDIAHGCGVSLEGSLPLSSIANTTDIKKYIENTNIDSLYLSSESPHASGVPKLSDMNQIQLQQIREVVKLPLSMTAGGEFNHGTWQKDLVRGLTKVNLDLTEFVSATTDTAAKFRVTRAEDLPDKGIVTEVISHWMALLGSENRAGEIIENCRPWLPVEHLIIFNVTDITESEANEMMEKGKAVLSTIPGVRRVDIGKALTENAKYRYTWLVRFCHENVIASYRDHPVHVKFANELFRPVAGDRISIDYKIR